MAARKITFTLPEALAISFLKHMPTRDRSAYVAQALKERLADRERRLIRSCKVANEEKDVQEIEREFDALPDATSEPWTSAG